MKEEEGRGRKTEGKGRKREEEKGGMKEEEGRGKKRKEEEGRMRSSTLHNCSRWPLAPQYHWSEVLV